MFYKILRALNEETTRQLSEGNDIKLFFGLGTLEIRKYLPSVKLVDGKVVTNLPIDWKETWKLWEGYPEERGKKTLIRRQVSEIYKVFLNKSDFYHNRRKLKFFPSKKLRVRLKENINNGKIDAFTF